MIGLALAILIFGLVGLIMRNNRQLKEADHDPLIARNRIYQLGKDLRDA